MKIFVIFLLCGITLLSGCGIFTPTPIQNELPTTLVDPLEKLHADIDEVFQDPLFLTASVGIKVVAVATGEVIYEKDARKLHHPASTTKLFTAATALARLGSDYQFETTLYVDADADTQVVGNIYLKGQR